MAAPREYNNSLFGCFSSCGVCLKAFFCPCAVSGRNHYRIERGTDKGYKTCNGWCAAWCLLGMVGNWGCILQCLDRRNMQEKKNLKGSGFGACCASWCCTCCELVQTHRELDYVQLSQNERAVEKAGYQQQPGMVADQKVAVHNSPQPDHPGNPQVENGSQQTGIQQYGNPQFPQNGTQQHGSPQLQNGAQPYGTLQNGQSQPVMHPSMA